jgi:hypothetical protein
MKVAIVLMTALLVPGCGRTQTPQSLAVKDYDDFYNLVVLKAKNGDKAEWLASYDEVVGFVERVRQDVEKLPNETQLALARAVHDNGYWKGQELRVRDTADPFLGARFRSPDESLNGILTAKGFDDYQNRYTGGGGYRISLEAVADREGLYRMEGKTIPGLAQVPANTTIINANAQSWDDLVADAQRFSNPDERLAVIRRNQLNAIASALSLLRAGQARSDAEMDYATAVIWRYTGHYSGKDGWDREALVRLPYSELSEAEKAKDRDVWKAVREVLKTHSL